MKRLLPSSHCRTLHCGRWDGKVKRKSGAGRPFRIQTRSCLTIVRFQGHHACHAQVDNKLKVLRFDTCQQEQGPRRTALWHSRFLLRAFTPAVRCKTLNFSAVPVLDDGATCRAVTPRALQLFDRAPRMHHGSTAGYLLVCSLWSKTWTEAKPIDAPFLQLMENFWT